MQVLKYSLWLIITFFCGVIAIPCLIMGQIGKHLFIVIEGTRAILKITEYKIDDQI